MKKKNGRSDGLFQTLLQWSLNAIGRHVWLRWLRPWPQLWLDVIHTAIVAGHPSRMLAATFRGEFGNVISAPIMEVTCSACNRVSPFGTISRVRACPA